MLEIYAAFIFGLLGSLHCLGMCGPIVMAYTIPLTKSKIEKKLFLIVPHLFYNFGRTITYTLLGALAGSIGQQVFEISSLVKAERFAFIIFGIILLIAALLLAKVISVPNFITKKLNTKFAAYQKSIRKFLIMPSWSSKLLLGFLMGFLPCHLIYMMLLESAIVGTASKGALVMLAFGLGTMPMLILAGFFSNFLSSSIRNWGDKLVTTMVFILAIVLLIRGAGYDILTFGHTHCATTSSLHHH